MEKNLYLCTRYPENNLFTLKKLIPIEDSKRSPEKVIAFFGYIRQSLHQHVGQAFGFKKCFTVVSYIHSFCYMI